MLALFVLLAMLALFIGSLVLLVKVVRVVFPGSQDGRRRPKAARVVSSSGERRKPVRIGGRPVTAAPQTSSAGARLASPELTATWRYRQFLQLGAEPVTAAGAAMAEGARRR